MARAGYMPGAATLHLVDGVALLRPDEQVLAAMLDGWRNQQLARGLAFSTIQGRENAVRAFVRHADAQVGRVRGAGRKGWLPAFRDATMLKTAYAFGLRRNELRMLDVVDLGRNPHGPQFGDYGVCYVRHGKAMKGSPPKQRSVLTVWAWTAEILEQWAAEVRPRFATAAGGALWPSERGGRVGFSQMNTRLAAYRDALGLDAALDLHSLRRAYVTHLIEDGWDPRFVQEQVGHEHASTTSLYTCVSSDFRIRTLRRVLDQTTQAALRPAPTRRAR